MEYINLPISVFRSDRFLDSDNADKGTWIQLIAYCADQENGGVIAGCADWDDRKWLRNCRVSREDTQRACDMWTWEGADLRVHDYPLWIQAKVRKKREDGVKAAGKRWGKGKQQPEAQPSNDTHMGTHQETHMGVECEPITTPKGKPMRKEEKKESKEKKASKASKTNKEQEPDGAPIGASFLSSLSGETPSLETQLGGDDSGRNESDVLMGTPHGDEAQSELAIGPSLVVETGGAVPDKKPKKTSKSDVPMATEGIPDEALLYPWGQTPEFAQAWRSYIQMRIANGFQATAHAAGLVIKRLASLLPDDPVEVLNNSTMNTYRGVFPLPKDKYGKSLIKRQEPKLYFDNSAHER